ncbi:hypothetical protein LY78DRAFT_224380 [Colletotrichum sublineola]|nr:hypothetical protein LY78DRAFT_224380 [Colletotrichum sublineola]
MQMPRSNSPVRYIWMRWHGYVCESMPKETFDSKSNSLSLATRREDQLPAHFASFRCRGSLINTRPPLSGCLFVRCFSVRRAFTASADRDQCTSSRCNRSLGIEVRSKCRRLSPTDCSPIPNTSFSPPSTRLSLNLTHGLSPVKAWYRHRQGRV